MSRTPESPRPAENGTRAHPTHTALALGVAVAAIAFGTTLLGLRVWSGAGDWALSAAVGFGIVLALLAALGLSRRASSFELAFAALAWCFPAALVCDLFPYATVRHMGSGPSTVPVYIALALLSGLFALGSPAALARSLSAAGRGCFLIVFWATADGRLFQRDGQTAATLLAAASLLIVATHGRALLQVVRSGGGRTFTALLALLVAWWVLATVFGDSWRLGVQALTHLVTGIAVAAALLSVLDEHEARRCVGGFALGLVVACVLLAAALVEMLPYNELGRILATRLRLLDTHPNQIAPLFAAGICLLAPLLFLARGERSEVGLPRGVLIVTVLVLAASLAWTRSRGNVMAVAVGLVVALAGARGLCLRRPARVLVPLGLLGVVLTGVLASPLAASLRAKLEASMSVHSAVGERLHLWQSAVAAIASHPWFGLGPTQYYAHARFAEPSFYDGMNQSMHPHSILLAAGESAGVPGLLLFIALVVGVLALGRRRVLEAGDTPARRLWAGLLGAVCAVLAANLIDIPQGVPTLVPLILWLALGLFAAGNRTGAERASPGSRPLLFSLAAALLLPLALMPMIGKVGYVLGRELMSRGEAWQASRVYRVLARLHPWELPLPPLPTWSVQTSSLVGARLQLGQRDRALELVEAMCHDAPGRVSSWMMYGELLLAEGRAEEALSAFETAVAADPRGAKVGALALSRARALIALGRVSEARALLLDGLIETGGAWSKVPAEIELTQVLRELADRGLGLALTDEVLARRIIGRVAEGYKALGDPASALELVREYSELVEAMASLQVVEVQLFCQLEDYEGASEAYHTSPHAYHPFMTAAYLRGIGPSVGTPRERDYLDLPLDLRGTGNMDAFFSAELSANVFDVEAHRELVRGDEASAVRYFERSLYHLVAAPRRLEIATGFFERACEVRASNETLRVAVSALLTEASRSPALARRPARAKGWAKRVRPAWNGATDEVPAELERALSRAGALGAAFRSGW